jgi:hypothetical protein
MIKKTMVTGLALVMFSGVGLAASVESCFENKEYSQFLVPLKKNQSIYHLNQEARAFGEVVLNYPDGNKTQLNLYMNINGGSSLLCQVAQCSSSNGWQKYSSLHFPVWKCITS